MGNDFGLGPARSFVYIRMSVRRVLHGVERWLCNPRVSGSRRLQRGKVVYLDENSWTHTKTNSNRVIEFVG